MSERRIELGDTVDMILFNDDFLHGEVRSMPQDTGDCWVIEDKNGNIIHVQHFQHVIRYKPTSQPPTGGRDECA